MITAAVVTFHTSRKDLVRLMDCVLQSSIDKFFIIDNSTMMLCVNLHQHRNGLLIFIATI